MAKRGGEPKTSVLYDRCPHGHTRQENRDRWVSASSEELFRDICDLDDSLQAGADTAVGFEDAKLSLLTNVLAAVIIRRHTLDTGGKVVDDIAEMFAEKHAPIREVLATLHSAVETAVKKLAADEGHSG